MKRSIRILLQTTIPETEDDWHIGRFSLLRDHLASLKDEAGNRLCQVTARNRESDAGADDPVLSTLDRSDFDELWLFAVDIGDGLTAGDCQGITRFRQRGGGILATRDHQDLGSSLCTLGIVFTCAIPTRMNHGAQLMIPTRDRSHGRIIIPVATATIK